MNNPKTTTLLFGMPRSGTTWIGKIFDSHPDSLYRHEPDSQLPIDAIPLFLDSRNDTVSNIKTMSDFLQSTLTVRKSKVCTKLPFFYKKYLNLIQNTMLKTSIYITKAPNPSSLQISLLYSPDYIKKINQIHLIWKSIESLGRLGFLLQNYSDIKGVHIIRHPCGYIASVMQGEKNKQFSDFQPSSEDYGIFTLLLQTQNSKKYNLTIELLKKLSPVERLAWRWVLYNEKTVSDCNKMDNYTITYYDNLCKNTLDESKRLFEFTGLPWNNQTESFIQSSTANKNKENDSYYSVYKNPEQAANKWKELLSEKEVNQIVSIVKLSSLEQYIAL